MIKYLYVISAIISLFIVSIIIDIIFMLINSNYFEALTSFLIIIFLSIIICIIELLI